MKKLILILLVLLSLMTLMGCSVMKRTNTPEAVRKSDNATPKENTQQDAKIEVD